MQYLALLPYQVQADADRRTMVCLSRCKYLFIASAILASVPSLGLVINNQEAQLLPAALGPRDVGIQCIKRADPNLTGYLGAFFLGADPYVYFYLSNGNNAISFKALNKGSPVIKPTKGTEGVRDPAIVQGGGTEAGKKWYIVGTDLDIAKVIKWALSFLSLTDMISDHLGRCSAQWISRHLCMGEHGLGQLDE